MTIKHDFLMLSAVLAASLTVCSSRGAEGWKPVDPPMLTKWAKDIDPACPRPEYPRPQLTRGEWKNLNGLWNYAVVKQGGARPSDWDGRILVPFGIESSLSGVKRAFMPDEVLYYQRNIEIPDDWSGRRIILHFGAVDYASEVFVNGKRVGGHEGGYNPFSFDITDYIAGAGVQSLVVKVTDGTSSVGKPRGKQTLHPNGIMYTPTSGIWQTVWLEPVSQGAIEDLHILPDLKNSEVVVDADLYGNADGEIKVTVGNQSVTGKVGKDIRVPISNPVLWSPENPYLYDMTVEVIRDGKVADKVGTYFGMRSIELAEVDGVQRLLLNGEPCFMFGPLDQGFWPDGVYTAPTDEAMKYDLDITKQFGFNMTRKHIKVEPARWYYYADKLGLLVWQDMPSVNSYDPPNPRPEIDRDAYETQLRETVDNLENHPSIVMWVVFNESQGKHDVIKLTTLARKLDPSRLVNEDSGGQDNRYYGVGDVADFHPYPAPRAFDAPDHVAFVLGEYGGIGLKVGDNNPWQDKGWGYTNTKDSRELEDLYAQFAGKLRQYRDENGLCAAVYTQITDVEIEINGLMTYDRKLKVDPELIAKANRFEWTGPVYTSLVPTSDKTDITYEYTFNKPDSDWMKANADTRDWKKGLGGFGINTHARTGTEWNSSDIWVRRTFKMPKLNSKQLENLAINLFHDDAVEIWLNGVLILEKDRWESDYKAIRLSDAAKKALKQGKENVIAIHCHQDFGGQYIDFGLGILDPAR